MICELGFPQRRLVRSKDEILKFVQMYNGYRNLYLTLYEFRRMKTEFTPDYDSAIVPFVFFDFDGEESYKGAKKFTKFLADDGIKYRVNFSGGGFHIFVSVHGNATRRSVRDTQCKILDDYNLLKYNDPHVVGDLARICRIPNTWNLNKKRFCIPLEPHDLEKYSFDEIKTMAQKQRWIENTWSEGISIELEEIQRDREIHQHEIEYKEPNTNGIEPCVQYILEKRNPTHDERFFLVQYLSYNFRKGVSIDYVDRHSLINQIVEYLRKLNWSDWNEEYTRYQVQNIIQKRMNNVPSHEWRIQKGMCQGVCKYYEIERVMLR